jgi:hypothetical protein
VSGMMHDGTFLLATSWRQRWDILIKNVFDLQRSIIFMHEYLPFRVAFVFLIQSVCLITDRVDKIQICIIIIFSPHQLGIFSLCDEKEKPRTRKQCTILLKYLHDHVYSMNFAANTMVLIVERAWKFLFVLAGVVLPF